MKMKGRNSGKFQENKMFPCQPGNDFLFLPLPVHTLYRTMFHIVQCYTGCCVTHSNKNRISFNLMFTDLTHFPKLLLLSPKSIEKSIQDKINTINFPRKCWYYYLVLFVEVPRDSGNIW